MKQSRFEAAIADFLRDALSGAPLSVSKLGALARAAGLLREHQEVTGSKLFNAPKNLSGYGLLALGLGLVASGYGNCPPEIVTVALSAVKIGAISEISIGAPSKK